MYGIPVQDAISDDYANSIESSFEQKRGAPLMKPPREALPEERKPTRKDLVREANRAEAIVAQDFALLGNSFEIDTEQSQDGIYIAHGAAEFLVDRYLDDLHNMALPEADNPTLL